MTPTGVVFPKLGEIRAILHRPIVGTPKRCTIVREVDQWFVAIQCEAIVDAPASRLGPVVAIDRGITHLLADSDGTLVPNPKHLERALARLRRAQRVVSRRQKGSRRRARAATRVAKIHRTIRRQRGHVLHELSSRYAKSHGVVVVEKLNVAGMVKGGLGRHIAGAGWSTFCTMLRYKLEATGGTLVEVPAHYSSQTCTVCGVVDATSRSGVVFACVACCTPGARGSQCSHCAPQPRNPRRCWPWRRPCCKGACETAKASDFSSGDGYQSGHLPRDGRRGPDALARTIGWAVMTPERVAAMKALTDEGMTFTHEVVSDLLGHVLASQHDLARVTLERDEARAALDRLAAVTVDEVAHVITDAHPYAAPRWDALGETMRDEWRLAATAVLGLLRARRAGP